MYVYSFHHHIINSFFDLLFRSIILSQKKRKKNRPPSSFIHSFIVCVIIIIIIIIMSSSPSTTHTTTKKVFVSSSPVVKTVLFGVLASTVIASFAFASENAHILVQQVRGDSTRVFSLSSRFPDRIQPPMMRESSPLLRADDAIFDSHPLSLFVHNNNNNNNNNRPYRKTRSSKARTSPSLSRPRTRD